ncbi:hypothetical protein ACFLVS_02640 [Chloroflexota bacterium]
MEQINENAATWLHFIRPDYYVAIELEKQEINPEQFGLTSEGSCDNGRCDKPFLSMTDSEYLGGCGGMEALIK